MRTVETREWGMIMNGMTLRIEIEKEILRFMCEEMLVFTKSDLKFGC